jgi:hypothetical protein
MKILNAMALSVVLLPALSLGSVAFAAEGSDAAQAEAQPAQEQYMSSKPAGAFHAGELIGSTVKHRGSDENIGEIQDLIVDEDGQVLGVVLTTGGFLGLGGQSIGLGWDQLEQTMEGEESVLYVDMDEETLRSAPEYKRD